MVGASKNGEWFEIFSTILEKALNFAFFSIKNYIMLGRMGKFLPQSGILLISQK